MRVDVWNSEFTVEDLLEVELAQDGALGGGAKDEKTARLWNSST
jgi:hypothetical protein